MEYMMNSMWVLAAGGLVFFMQAGFALLEAGLARQKNTINILMKNLMDFGLGTVAYCLVGFGLMYGADKAGIIGTSLFANPLGYDAGEALSTNVFFFFQLVFCAATATIVSGAMAERTKFGSYLIFSFLISAFIYPVSGHWIWGGGWLSKIGFMDFAGSTAVHSAGGWAALMGALIVGPRIGKFTKEGKVNAFPPSNLFMATLGLFILWLGWYGFNPGSELAFNENVLYTAVTTTIAAGVASIVAIGISWIRYGKPDLGVCINGTLAGLVAVTAGCKYIDLIGAACIGAMGAVVVVFSVEFFDKVAKIDDPVGAISVHGICGSLGTLCVGLFACRETETMGLFYGGGFKLDINCAIGGEYMKPIIGIVPLVDKQKDSYWMLPGYMNGIKKAGGIPVMLPLTGDTEDLSSLLQNLDGIIFSGGQDINPKLYQELNLRCSELCKKRDNMEVKLLKQVIEDNKPAYGICRGLQLFNACLGGSLYQDIPTQLPSDIEHVQKPPYDKAINSVKIYKGTLLYDIVGKEQLEVNSYHHQGIKEVAPSLEIMAVAPDGLVEAVYMPTKRFIMATQWHPEFSYKTDENSLKIFKTFVAHCAEYRKGRGNDNG